jgi:hypothetical protein
MNTRVLGSLLMAAGFLAGCASSHEAYPAASPPTASTGSVVRYPEGHYVLRGDGTPGAPYQWEWVQRPRASSPAPEAQLVPARQ